VPNDEALKLEEDEEATPSEFSTATPRAAVKGKRTLMKINHSMGPLLIS
jgi:hypothetical protein